MQNNELNTAKEYLKGHARQHRWRSIVAVLSCLVIICTVYMLTQPATTMSTDIFCGMDEHTHSDACFEQVLVCDENTESMPSPHEHTNDCYEAQEVLACNQGLNEDGTEHIHTAECYQEEMVLVCPYENSEETVSTEHVHSAECYARGDLICQIPEHTHTLQCNSNPNAVESPEMWTAGIPALTGDAARDVVAVAESQLGYTESSENFRVNEDGSISGYTRYGAWYGGGNGSDFAYDDWCASFVSFCLNHAGISQNDFPYSAGCADWTQRLIESDLYAQADAHTPQAGDIVFLNMNGYGVDHVGIVTGMDESAIETIEGNFNGSVARSTHIIGSSEILGYGFLPDGKQEDDNEQSDDEQINVVSDAHETIQISVTTEQSTYHEPKTDSNGVLLYYTGESAITTLSISNPTSSKVETDDGAVVRVYMKFNGTTPITGRASDIGGPAMAPGTYTISASGGAVYDYTVTQLDDTTYCFEIQRPVNGDTINLTLPSGYSSPNSAGGTNEIWGVILTNEEKNALDSGGSIGIAPKPQNGENQQTVKWDTRRDDFLLTKTQTSTQNCTLRATGDGTAYVSGLEWAVQLKRTGDTLEGIGKDHMRYAEFTDVLSLPEGVKLSDSVLESLRNDTYTIEWVNKLDDDCGWVFYDQNGEKIVSLKCDGDYISSQMYNKVQPRLRLTDDERMEISWTVYHQEYRFSGIEKDIMLSTEISSIETILSLGNSVVQVSEPEANKTYTIRNDVSSEEYFSWSSPDKDAAQSEVPIMASEGRFELNKVRTLINDYMGNPTGYEITAENPGITSYNTFGSLQDKLPDELYLSGKDIVELLTDAKFGEKLTISILNATICQHPEVGTVYDINGTLVTGIAGQNTSVDSNPNKYRGMQETDPSEIDTNAMINLKKNGQGIQISYNGVTVDCAADANAVQAALDGIGFIITSNATYQLSWNMTNTDGTGYSLAGGEKLTFKIPCTQKDTFMLLDKDTEYAYPQNWPSVGYNFAYAYSTEVDNKGNPKRIGDAMCYYYSYKRDMYFTKEVMGADGTKLEEVPADGSILSYTLNVTRNGGIEPLPLLPVTDHMSGAQILLAEVETNHSADWAASMSDSDIFTASDGTRYYKLTRPGTYKNVWVNGALADSVSVTETESGRDTLIKWYLSNLDAAATISYKSLFCPKELVPAALSWTLGNESWLNDHETHRLYASTQNLEKTTFLFDKRIVSENDINSEVKESGTNYSAISEGETVYYRFTFYPGEDGYTLTGKDLYDALPLSLMQENKVVLHWTKSTEKVPGAVFIMGYQGYPNGGLSNGDHYRIEGEDNQQYIRWDNDFKVTVKDRPLYIYVRLTFPTGDEWNAYCAEYSKLNLENTLHVQNFSDTVTHGLSISAKAYLQKGVYSTEGYMKYGNYAPLTPRSLDTLFYYSNEDALYHVVTYYVVLYNAGNTRLYIQDMQDVLPEGFTFKWLRNRSDIGARMEWKTMRNPRIFDDTFADSTTGENVTWRSGMVSVATDKSNPQKLTFHITGASSRDDSIRYDETLGLYYLDPNEGLSFGYSCETHGRAETQDIAVNRVAMPYYDYNHGGVVASDTPFTRMVTGSLMTRYIPNEGGCDILDNTTAENDGFTGSESGTQWLASEVTISRGGIQPGITKALTSTTSAAGVETQAPIIAAYPTDTLHWTITADNDGYIGLQDYVLTDTMQSPYMFTGKVNYYIIDREDSKKRIIASAKDYLFSIDKTENDTVELTSNLGVKANAVIGGEPAEFNVEWRDGTTSSSKKLPIRVQFTENPEKGVCTISIRFMDAQFGIPGKCSGILTLDTKDPTNNLENKTYVNTSFLTPMSQTWDGTVNKGNLTTLDAQSQGERPTVRNSAPVTTSYGYTTSSLKSVFQTDDPSNATNSNRTPNYIVLPDRESEFTYTLSVENSDKALQSIVLIDGLPEVGDHSSFQTDDGRFSEFKVRLADEPGLSVLVKAVDGTLTELTPTQYAVEYSTKTDFDQSDWSGDSAWTGTAAEARSLRIKIFDTTGTLIPAKATISVSFNAVIDGDAAPGQIAWNSFGYHYSVVGSSAGLEAAPLKVGVMLPTVPKIQKSLIGGNGTSVEAAENETFRFICYTGSSLNLSDEKQLGAALDSNARKATLIELDVSAGSSTSALTMLDNCVVYRYEGDSWHPTDEAWSWTSQAQYTLVELTDENSLYYFDNINKRTGVAGYSFYYRPGEQLILSAVNRLDTWNFTIHKVDADDLSPLDGAWFALYSPEETDKMSDEAFQMLMDRPNKKPAETIDHDGRTWYLAGVEKSCSQNGVSGILLWDMLYRDEYVYCEVQAPHGHALDQTMHIARKDSQTHSVTIINEKSGYELPQTGGYGIIPFYLAGTILLLMSGGILFRKKKHG